MVLIDLGYLLNVACATRTRDKYTSDEEREIDVVNKILSDIIRYKNEFGHNFGKTIIATDDRTRNYWRKEVYPLYKSSREDLTGLYPFKQRSPADEMRDIWISVSQTLKNSSITPLEVSRAEADDIIAVLCGLPGRHVIISPDKDFLQLLSDDVEQFSPISKELITKGCELDKLDLLDHIVDGDRSDAIPSIFSHRRASDSFKIWFKKTFGLEITDEVYRAMIAKEPRTELLYKLDLLDDYRNNIGYYEGSDTFFSTILNKEIDIKRLPSSYKQDPSIKKEFQNAIDKGKIFAKDKILSYNYRRNQRLIDLSNIDTSVVSAITSAFNSYERGFGDLKPFCAKYRIPLSEIK